MSLLHFKTHNQLSLGVEAPLVRMKTSPQLLQRPQNTRIENLYNLLTKFINEPNYLFMMGPRGDKTRQKGDHTIVKFAEMLQVEHSCPIPKLQHRTSIEANLTTQDQKDISSDGPNRDTMGGLGSSEFHLFQSEPACASFDATQYLTYLQLQELFQRQEPELMVYSVGLLCKYLQVNNESLTRHNVLRLFATSVFLSFKLHLEYDMNIIDFVSETLEMDRKLFSSLQKSFCRMISYDLSVSQNILSWLRRQLLF